MKIIKEIIFYNLFYYTFLSLGVSTFLFLGTLFVIPIFLILYMVNYALIKKLINRANNFLVGLAYTFSLQPILIIFFSVVHKNNFLENLEKAFIETLILLISPYLVVFIISYFFGYKKP